MTPDLSPADQAKLAAARRSVALVEDGMKLGLGTGSTAAWMVRCLAERVREEGLRLSCVPTSQATAALAARLGLTLTTLDETPRLDLTIDGTDEFDPDFNLIKGGGGAHLREKIVATASADLLVIADASKEVGTLGAFPLPVEVIEFGLAATRAQIADALAAEDLPGTESRLRMAGSAPFRTDQGNLILDLHLHRIPDPRRLALLLNRIPGVVENGLFLGLCSRVVIGHADGSTELREAGRPGTDRRPPDGRDADNLFDDLPG
ncbi:MAG: ribose-5-phosphate isomerase RpiA [Alkalilacustris sp.]